MTEAVFDISADQTVEGISPFQFEIPKISIDREVLIVGIVLALLQVADGVLTGIGMAHFGTSAEGNPLLRALMHQMGYIPALVAAKSISIMIVATLCLLAAKINWVVSAMKLVALVYIGAAVVPWSIILGSRFLFS